MATTHNWYKARLIEYLLEHMTFGEHLTTTSRIVRSERTVRKYVDRLKLHDDRPAVFPDGYVQLEATTCQEFVDRFARKYCSHSLNDFLYRTYLLYYKICRAFGLSLAQYKIVMRVSSDGARIFLFLPGVVVEITDYRENSSRAYPEESTAKDTQLDTAVSRFELLDL